MSFTNSPNMGLPIPNVGTEPGPNYAFDINSSLALIDSHNHNPGSGVQITPSGLNINASLPFNNNVATNVGAINLFPQLSAPQINSVYDVSGDLYFIDGLGREIQITSNGNVNSGAGSINGLPSGTASASYIAINGTFVWQSATGIPANMDFGAALFRNLTNNINYVKVQPPASLGSTWTLTLPQLPTGSTKLVTLDTSGQFAAVTDVDNATIVIDSNIIKVPDGGIGTAQIADGAVTPVKLSFDISLSASGTEYNTPGTFNFVIPAGCEIVLVSMLGGGGGGGGGAGNAGGSAGGGGAGSGGAGAGRMFFPYDTVPGEVMTIVVGAGGAGGAGGNSSSLGPITGGSNGSPGADSTISTPTNGLRRAHGAGGGLAGGVNGGNASTVLYQGQFNGGNGGNSSGSASTNGTNTIAATGGTGGASSGSNGGGGGGGSSERANGPNGGAGNSGSGVGNNGGAGTLGAGGGGGGGCNGSTSSSTGGTGGAGGGGAVVITYVKAT